MLFLQGEDYKNRLLSNYNIYKYINIFDAVVESGNFKKASIQLNISISSISKNIKTLETMIGVRLFDRNGCKGLKLNDFGLQFKVYCENAKKSINNIYNFIENIDDKETIKICAHPLAFNSYLYPSIKKVKTFNNYKIKFFIEKREAAINKFKNKHYDVMFFPLDNLSISKIDFYSNLHILGDYKLCLFINKKSKFKSLKHSVDISLNNFTELNVMPINKQYSFNLYTDTDILDGNKNSVQIDSDNIDILINGVKNNLWIAATGKEAFYDYNCNHSNVYIIEITSNSNLYTTIKWCFIYQQNISNTKQQIIKQLLQEIITIFHATND